MFVFLFSDRLNGFYVNVAAFPTVIFSVMLVVCVLFWLVAMLGFVDIDALDIDLPDGFDVPGADDLLHATHSAHHEILHADGLAGLLLRFGLNGVPLTIVITLVTLFGWLISYYSSYALSGVLPFAWLRFLIGIPVFVASLIGGMMITSVLVKPIRPFFKKTEQVTRKQVLGQVAIIKTSKVTETFGEAEFQDGGAGLILKVRTSEPNDFKKGDKVVLLEYLAGDNTYRIISETEFNK